MADPALPQDDTTPLSPAQFRGMFPAFADSAKYPDVMLVLWAGVAVSMVGASRWGEQVQLGRALFIAHNLTIDGMSGAEAARGGFAGLLRGPIVSESGDKVSVAFATANLMDPSAGHWNMTVYGVRYWSLMRIFGAGPIQVAPCITDGQAGAYGGPLFGEFGNGYQ